MKPALQRYEEKSAQTNYQVELGTKALLTLFFAVACICGMFFAFGYTLGKHAIPATFTLGAAPPPTPAAATAPPAPAGTQAPSATDLGAAEANQSATTLEPPPAAAATIAPPPAAPPPAATPPAATPPVATSSAPPPDPSAPATTASAPYGIYRVQVFAGSLGDANSVATALRARGYPIIVAPPQPGESDQFYRVHVGPYKSQDEANAARSRLTADGYANAVVVTVNK